MPVKVKTYDFLRKFSCLGAECPDTCCRGWDMQVDGNKLELYKKEAPELLNALTSGGSGLIMKRDPATDYCVKFDNGLCSIHKEKGDKFLGDACHFYPRITRKLGNEVIMSAALSCPEIVRLAFFEGGSDFSTASVEIDRLPLRVKDYLHSPLSEEKALYIIEKIIEMAADQSVSPEIIISRLTSIANSLQNIDISRWPEAIDLLIKVVDGRLPPPEKDDNDFLNLIYTLAGLIHASHKKMNSRFDDTFKLIQNALGVTVNIDSLEMTRDFSKEANLRKLKEFWLEDHNYDEVLRRWIQVQLAMASFPFAGFGNTVFERAEILAIRFATVKMALLSYEIAYGEKADNDAIIKIIQGISRFMDHLASPELSLNIYREAGWNREARIRGLLG